MNDDLEKICMSVLTEATNSQMGSKLSGSLKIMMSETWKNIINGMSPEQRKNSDVLFNTILIAINMGLSQIANNFTNAINNGYQKLSNPADTKFNILFNNKEIASNIVKDYANEVLRAISSIDENAIFNKYMNGNQNVQPTQTAQQTSIQQDANMLEKMRAAQVEKDPSKRMKMLADIDAEIDNQKAKTI